MIIAQQIPMGLRCIITDDAADRSGHAFVIVAGAYSAIHWIPVGTRKTEYLQFSHIDWAGMDTLDRSLNSGNPFSFCKNVNSRAAVLGETRSCSYYSINGQQLVRMTILNSDRLTEIRSVNRMRIG